MTDLELLDIRVTHYVLQLVGWQRPHSISVLCAMFSDDFAVQFVELDEVWPSEHKIFEKLGTFNAGSWVRITEIADWNRATLQTIAVILSGHWDYDDALVVSIVEDRAHLLFVWLVEKEDLFVLYKRVSLGRNTYVSYTRCTFRSPAAPLQIDCSLLASQARSFFFASCLPA